VDLTKLYDECGHGEVLERLTTEALCGIRPRRKQSKHADESFASFARRRLQASCREFIHSLKQKLEQPEQLHEFRVDVKALRYRLELLKPAFAEDQYEQTYRLIKNVARRLGKINDHAMAEAMFLEWRQAFPEPATTRLLKRARRQERKALCKSLDDFSDWWSSRRKRQLRKQLNKLVETTVELPMRVAPSPVDHRMRPAK
jgi:CHAD domain-containing protein